MKILPPFLALLLASCSSTREKRPDFGDPLAGQKITRTITVKKTIRVRKGRTIGDKDASGITHYVAHSSLGDGGQSEDQDPVFIFEAGSRAVNIAWTGAKGADVLAGSGGEVRWKNVHGNPLGKKKKAFERFAAIRPGARLRVENWSVQGFDDKAFNPQGGTRLKLYNGRVRNGKRFYSTLWKRRGKKTRTAGNELLVRGLDAEDVVTLFKINQAGDGGEASRLRLWDVKNVAEYSMYGKKGSLKIK